MELNSCRGLNSVSVHFQQMIVIKYRLLAWTPLLSCHLGKTRVYIKHNIFIFRLKLVPKITSDILQIYN